MYDKDVVRKVNLSLVELFLSHMSQTTQKSHFYCVIGFASV